MEDILMQYNKNNYKYHVMEIQKYLSGISYYNNKIPKIIPDGIYGKETQIAVKAFQQEYNLPITGEINRITWEKIVEIYKGFTSTPESIVVFPSNTYTIKQGDKGYEIMFIQIMLNAVMENGNNYEKIPVNGFYDIATVRAVKEFQKLSQMTQTGSVNIATWNIMVKSFNYIMR
jgi:peptidoglycan hydrolase-like protein with peptidoglycan-binding domain